MIIPPYEWPQRTTRAVDGSDRLTAGGDIVVQVPKRRVCLAAARQWDGERGDPSLGERLSHFVPPPRGIANAGAVDEHQCGREEHVSATGELRVIDCSTDERDRGARA